MHMWIQLMVYACIMTSASTIEIPECPNKSVGIVEGLNFSLTCRNYTGTASWTFTKPSKSQLQIGTCDSSCSTDPLFDEHFTLTHLSASSSRLTFKTKAVAQSFGPAEYACEGYTCNVIIVADVCLNETCNDHGTCNRTTNGTCDCDLGYEGENCADLCLNKTCNGHGTCNRTTGGTCDCDPGYEGENCNSSIPADTTQPPTPAIRDCDFCECCDCEDTGGCWKCILMICIIIVLPPLCISIYCCCCCCFCYWCCREKTKKRLERIYKRIDKFVARCLCKKKNQDKGPSDKPVDSTGVEPEAPHPPLLLHLRTIPQDKSDHKPTNPNGPKRGKQIAEKSDMNELRDIPSSPDQYERSHPAKGSRDLPQPRAGGGGQVNVTHSSTPRSLLPVQAVTPLPSVERNSYAESRKLPLPSIDSKDAH